MNTYNNSINGYNSLFGGVSTPTTNDAYQELLRLKNTPFNQYRTVFNDIADE